MIFRMFRSELDRQLEQYESEQRSSAKNIETFSLLTSEQVLYRENCTTLMVEKIHLPSGVKFLQHFFSLIIFCKHIYLVETCGEKQA